MNPFSGFLQPQNNRPLQGLVTTQDLLRVNQGNKEMAQRQLENTQQNTRANANLKLQQDYQTHSFEKDAHGRTVDEQKQIEGLLAEYQDAEDQGDPVRLGRASQMLKRFGMDVSGGNSAGLDPRAAVFTGGSLKAMTGERLLPDVQKNPATVGTESGQPIDAVVAEELKSREALRARSAAPEQDLSQGDFEEQLINGTQAAPSRYEEAGKTTDEFRKMLPQDEPEDLGDVDDPAFKAAAAQETGAVIDLDAESPGPLQIGAAPQAQQAAQPPRRLSTQLLPTVISKGGKQLYESTGPSGRWAPMVAGVFEPYVGHENPQIAAAAKSASQLAQKLIQVDDIPPKEAIKIASDQMMKDAGLTIGLERTKLGTKPKGGAAGALTSGISFKADGTLNDDLDKVRTMFVNSDQYKNVVQKRLLVEGATQQLQSANGMSQQEAVSTLRRIQSGLTLNAFETQEFNNAAGAIEGIYNKFNKLAGGGQLSPEYKRQLQEVYSRINQTLDSHTERLAQAAYEYWMGSRKRSGPSEIIEEKGRTLKDSLGGGVSSSGKPSGYDPELD